jgi:ABC-type branched-subunit amino acid transport system substrate-binding protein
VVESELREAHVTHVAHGDHDPVAAALSAVNDPQAGVVIGPFRSRDVAEVVEITAPARLAVIAPVATWVGVTRNDEPGSEVDPADHRGTVFRLVARDSVVAQYVADHVRARGEKAILVAGKHEYGDQVARQLRRASLPEAATPEDADVIVLAGLARSREIKTARSLAPLPIIAFDGIGAERFPDQTALMAIPFAPDEGGVFAAAEVRRAAQLAIAALRAGGDVVGRLRQLGPFDDHGDLLQAAVRLVPVD